MTTTIPLPPPAPVAGYQPVAVRNTHPDGVRAHFSVRNGDSLSWARPGDPGDTIEVPGAIVASPAFRRAVARGIFEILTDEAYLEQIYADLAREGVSGAEAIVIPGAEIDRSESMASQAVVFSEEAFAEHIKNLERGQS